MQETVVYIRVPASEPPANNNNVFVYIDNHLEGAAFYTPHLNIWSNYKGDDYSPDKITYWLKPVPLSSLLQEGAAGFAEWIIDAGWRLSRDKNLHKMYYNVDDPDKNYHKIDELFKLFIEEKYGKEAKRYYPPQCRLDSKENRL